MADLNRSQRGQMILIAAFILAIAFVVLALVVNSAIFTENLATRDDVAGSHEALEYRAEVVGSVGALIESANADPSMGSTEVIASIDENISSQAGFDQSALGHVVGLSYAGETAGKRIAQDNGTRNFTDTAGQEDWVLAEDVSNTRNIKFNITEVESLPIIEDDLDFQFHLNDTSDPDTVEWEMDVEYDGFNDVTVQVTNGLTGLTATCSREWDGTSLEIDVTGGTVGGEPCHALDRDENGEPLWFGAGVDTEYQLEFVDANAAMGTYSMVIEDDASSSVSDNLVDGHDPDEPYKQTNDILYSVDVEYMFHTSQVGYETTIEDIAPGEVPP